MRKIPTIAILILTVMILIGIYAGSSNLVTQASSQDVAYDNVVVFTIPTGDDGIHYTGNSNPDMPRWGPAAFTIAPDNTFWVADTPGNHILHFSSQGILLNKIATSEFIIGAADIEATSKEIWVLDVASLPPRVVKLSSDGKVLNKFDLPKGLHLEDGLSGIAIGYDGSVYVELEGGLSVAQFISPFGELDRRNLAGYEAGDKIYSIHPANLRSRKEASYGYIQVGNKQIGVTVANDLGGMRMLRINSDGSFFVIIEELVVNIALQVDQKVYRYDSSGNLTGMARVSLAGQYTPVTNGVVIGPDNEVYALFTKPNGAEVQKLTFFSNLPPILQPPIEEVASEQLQESSVTTSSCRPRATITNTAVGYMVNSTYLDTYHIDASGNNCATRQIPEYLTTQGWYSSVPYAWGEADTVQQFNDYMDDIGLFAGDTDEPNSGCGRGVDCSGLVTNAWGLTGGHHGTCTLEEHSTMLNDIGDLKAGDIMNRCLTGYLGHTIIFLFFAEEDNKQGMYGYESTTEFNHDKVVRIFRAFSTLSTYVPRKFNDVCEYDMQLPLIRNTTQTDLVVPPSNPYPAPFSDSYDDTDVNPYPYP